MEGPMDATVHSQPIGLEVVTHRWARLHGEREKDGKCIYRLRRDLFRREVLATTITCTAPCKIRTAMNGCLVSVMDCRPGTYFVHTLPRVYYTGMYGPEIETTEPVTITTMSIPLDGNVSQQLVPLPGCLPEAYQTQYIVENQHTIRVCGGHVTSVAVTAKSLVRGKLIWHMATQVGRKRVSLHRSIVIGEQAASGNTIQFQLGRVLACLEIDYFELEMEFDHDDHHDFQVVVSQLNYFLTNVETTMSAPMCHVCDLVQ